MEIFKITKRLDRDVIFIKKGYFWVRTLSVGLLLFFMLIGCTTIVPKSELEYSPIYSNPSLVKNKSMMIKVGKIQDIREVNKEEKDKAYIGKEVADTGWTANKYFLEKNVDDFFREVLNKELIKAGIQPVESDKDEVSLFLDCKIKDFWVRAGYFTSTLKSTVVIEMKLSNQNGNELLLSEGKGEHSAFFRGGDVKKDMTESLRKSFQEALEDCLIKLYMFLATT
ncbi:MAG: hypothetical protein A3C43_03140 [Candidatus Schekmanbacteria bacterium RIFCSPHIGHO2_02_FULL_38_11]|uniref:ABC-type transport auxiliary lipoprotein component domain-containing protein n=1 Tax=Candidatus Schekmanbacteria bacterium RIFCSPLOWO2_12_FULL_38_15 TaxID=1817883 RepID=A0A1F7SEC5_9BACT|nr:MAG: hypothetical protein A3H37_10395 [Candidatus Schekmanbacteria bacterium RIFCSPLOWO2_02_FULL_38_14]OGL52132.1 MAG: hypothetical protein A3G31_06855 [Candidatus Schekmanbacteria bacterium RIFCSPLOWO2_12_FULL_38_15]OGL53612.1 MAG: hypothetical protein A3C43_03140 [Candidatus Schekmanbacteria bacterium RIFCSPHIGHO2_02_FULL_38_11]